MTPAKKPELERRDGVVIGYRGWRLLGDRLHSTNAGAGSDVPARYQWGSGEIVADAVPTELNMNGLYACTSWEAYERQRIGAHVVGQVALSGKYVLGETGVIRAERARVLSLAYRGPDLETWRFADDANVYGMSRDTLTKRELWAAFDRAVPLGVNLVSGRYLLFEQQMAPVMAHYGSSYMPYSPTEYGYRLIRDIRGAAEPGQVVFEVEIDDTRPEVRVSTEKPGPDSDGIVWGAAPRAGYMHWGYVRTRTAAEIERDLLAYYEVPRFEVPGESERLAVRGNNGTTVCAASGTTVWCSQPPGHAGSHDGRSTSMPSMTAPYVAAMKTAGIDVTTLQYTQGMHGGMEVTLTGTYEPPSPASSIGSCGVRFHYPELGGFQYCVLPSGHSGEHVA